MKKFERIWNIVYYFVWLGMGKFGEIINKPTDLIVNNMPYFQRRFKEHNFDPKKVYLRVMNDLHFGWNQMYASGVMMILMVSIWMSIYFPIPKYCASFGANPELVLGIFIIGVIAFIFLPQWYFIWRGDKYIRYFREFKRKPHKWKVKWAWISLIIILIPIAIFALVVHFFL